MMYSPSALGLVSAGGGGFVGDPASDIVIIIDYIECMRGVLGVLVDVVVDDEEEKSCLSGDRRVSPLISNLNSMLLFDSVVLYGGNSYTQRTPLISSLSTIGIACMLSIDSRVCTGHHDVYGYSRMHDV